MVEKELSNRLFKDKVLNETKKVRKNPTPMILYCKDKKKDNFNGYKVDGFSTEFCDEFYPTPTEVGMCLTKDLNVDEINKLDDDYLSYTKSKDRKLNIRMGRGNRNAEMTFVLQSDIFEDINSFPKHVVSMSFVITKIVYYKYFSFLVHDAKNKS